MATAVSQPAEPQIQQQVSNSDKIDASLASESASSISDLPSDQDTEILKTTTEAVSPSTSLSLSDTPADQLQLQLAPHPLSPVQTRSTAVDSSQTPLPPGCKLVKTEIQKTTTHRQTLKHTHKEDIMSDSGDEHETIPPLSHPAHSHYNPDQQHQYPAYIPHQTHPTHQRLRPHPYENPRRGPLVSPDTATQVSAHDRTIALDMAYAALLGRDRPIRPHSANLYAHTRPHMVGQELRARATRGKQSSVPRYDEAATGQQGQAPNLSIQAQAHHHDLRDDIHDPRDIHDSHDGQIQALRNQALQAQAHHQDPRHDHHDHNHDHPDRHLQPDLYRTESGRASRSSHYHPRLLAPHVHRGASANVTASERAAAAALEDLTRRVREQSDRLQRALSPVADAVKGFAEARPVLFTFLAIFGVLSFIPVLFFLGFILAATVFLAGSAAIVLLFSILFTVLVAGAVVLPILVVTAALAFLGLSILLALFLAHRLYLHLSDASSRTGEGIISMATAGLGLRTWADETKGRVGLGVGAPGTQPKGRRERPGGKNEFNWVYPESKPAVEYKEENKRVSAPVARVALSQPNHVSRLSTQSASTSNKKSPDAGVAHTRTTSQPTPRSQLHRLVEPATANDLFSPESLARSNLKLEPESDSEWVSEDL